MKRDIVTLAALTNNHGTAGTTLASKYYMKYLKSKQVYADAILLMITNVVNHCGVKGTAFDNKKLAPGLYIVLMM